MLHLRITTPSNLTDQVLQIFSGDTAVSSLVVLRKSSVEPRGDPVLVDVAREAANEFVDRLVELGVPDMGTIHLDPVTTWGSKGGLMAEQHTPREQCGCRRLGGSVPAC